MSLDLPSPTPPVPSTTPESRDPHGLTVRSGRPADVHTTACLHIAHLGVGLFPRLGLAFVRRWHATYQGSPSGVFLVAEAGPPHARKVVGYLLGSTDEHAHTAHVLRYHRRELAKAGAIALAARPRVAATFIATRLGRYARRLLTRRSATTATHGRSAGPGVLTALVLDEAHRGTGAGRALVHAFEDIARRSGAQRLDLVTKRGSDGAGAFYEHLGWELVVNTTSKDGDGLEKYRRNPLEGRP